MQHYDVILFDVDGTLIDSAPGILNTLEEVFTKMGVDVTHVNLRRYLGRRSARVLESIFLTLQKSRRPPSSIGRVTAKRAAMRVRPTPVRQRCCAA